MWTVIRVDGDEHRNENKLSTFLETFATVDKSSLRKTNIPQKMICYHVFPAHCPAPVGSLKIWTPLD